jgi:hypothetical protein
MPSRSQYGRAMNDSFDQHPAHRPASVTGSRQAGHSLGNATSTARPSAARKAAAARADADRPPARETNVGAMPER